MREISIASTWGESRTSCICRQVIDSVKIISEILKLYMHVFGRRGSMCLNGEDSSEEDLTDTLYSEIDYII